MAAPSSVNPTKLRRIMLHRSVSTSKRTFASSPPLHRRSNQQNESSRTRLGPALGSKRIEWYWIPASAGIAFLGGVQFYKVYSREEAKKELDDSDDGRRPRKRDRVRPSGPWCVCNRCHCLGSTSDIRTGRSKSCPHCPSKPCRGCGASSMSSRFLTTYECLVSNSIHGSLV